MTILYIVAIRDRQLDAYAQPAFVPALGLAVRQFGDEVANPQSPLNKHPEDFALYQLGTYNDATGQFENLQQPKQIALADDYVKADK